MLNAGRGWWWADPIAGFVIVAYGIKEARRRVRHRAGVGGVSATVTVTAPPATRHSIRIRHREYPVVLPSVRDPRLHVAAVVISVQVLGQVSLGFELSIAQILVSILTCGVLEVAITFWRRHAIVWPASALLTGNGVALILRVPEPSTATGGASAAGGSSRLSPPSRCSRSTRSGSAVARSSTPPTSGSSCASSCSAPTA